MTTYPKIIMLTGKMGCGKTTAARILERHGFKEKFFASPLKEFARSLGFTEQEIYGTQAEKQALNKFWGVSGREFLQLFGTNVVRTHLESEIPNLLLDGKTLWARAMEAYIQQADPSTPIVVSDGRFLDEAGLITKYGGIIIKLVRDMPTLVHFKTGDCCETHTRLVNTHVSETELEKIRVVRIINNTGTLEELEEQLLHVCYNFNILNKVKPVSHFIQFKEDVVPVLLLVLLIGLLLGDYLLNTSIIGMNNRYLT